MSDDYSRVLNIVGLIFGLAGVLILFRWGMPFHVPTGGAVHLITGTPDPKEVSLERIYTVIGYLGLALLIGGTILQVVAALMPDKNLT